ncbi:hybrid sensor histidine kinase/response regulator [Hyunsoonleella flava]|uniref:histidine kinase n=1 Tax=Hyunsoonleella flava TaxID=2527939 RepID=A0A4Q9FK04_9FLAO|nr:hybrid sensor histidine kinase/response regulator transcription factor [Hyunsoonleella flava]TBN06704.1 hybrid sensor histidine kinase/response regulator [Hyunsoonleella flava]
MNYLRLLFFCFFTTFIFSQNDKHVIFRALTVEQGLSQNNVVSIAQDSIGFMWFNTEDGLNKYDGKETTTYYLTSNKIKREAKYLSREVFVDKIGKLWAINNYGKLNYYNQETDKFIELQKLKEVITIAQDSDLNYFIGTYGQGLFKIDYRSKDTIQILKPQDKHFAVCSFVETDKHSILATTDDGIIEIKNNNYEFIELASETIFSRFAKSSAGTIYLGSYEKGLYIKTKNSEGFKQFKGFDDNPLPDDLIVKDLLVDKRDWLWITTERRGVFLLDFKLKTIQNFLYNKEEQYSIGSNSLFFMNEDNSGTIWIGTKGAGVNYFDAYLSKFNLLTNDQIPNTIHIDGIRAITTDNKNAIWIGTESKGLTKIGTQKNSFFTYTMENSDLVGDRIVSLYYDDGCLWIGHLDNGLQILDTNGKMKTYNETSSFTILKIYKDAKGNMWLCTNKGLILFDKDKGVLKQFNSNNSGLTTNYYISTVEQDINTIEQGDANTLWVGTEFEGLYKLNLSDNKFSVVEGISDRIFSLYYNDSKLWIGTNGNGLKLYNTESGFISKFSTKDGLPNDIIYSILPDSDGYLWLTSNKGITRFKFENDSISSIKNYDNYFGLQSHGFNAGAYHKDKLGNLYFGGIKGINWFNPDELKTNPVLPKTALTKLELFNKEIPFSDNLELSSDQNTLSFSFASLQFSQPELNQYKYRLINNDEDWIDAGYNSIAHYTNLPPNNYTFQVISSNYDGVWNDEPATYSFTILKPWYGTNLAYTIYGLIVLSSLYFFFRYLKWRIQIKNDLEFEQKEAARLKQLDEFKNRLFTNISHEFRTPLTLISGPVENQLAKPNLNTEDKEELSIVKRNAARLLNLVNQILDISKLETGNLKLSVAHDNLELNLKQLVSTFKFKAQKKQIDFTYNIQPTHMVWFDKDVVDKITINLLSNAIKYTPQKGFVRFESFVENGHVSISVTNNGVNYSSEDLQKLFTRYYQAGKNSGGTGIGLALVKELAVLSHGNVVAHMLNNDEIQFTATLPIERSYFKASELSESPSISINDEQLQSDKETLNTKQLVLLVEDDDDIRQYVKSFLSKSYKVIETVNGKEGIKKATDVIPDIIISDIMMPLEDGIGLCNALKQNEKTSHIPIILLTAKAGKEHEISGLKVGADAYVTKPFNKEKLLVQIESLLNIRQQLQKKYSQNYKLKELAVANTEQQFLEKLYQVLNNSITENSCSAEFLSKKMLMSRMQLHRKLKALTGLSTTEFITKERLTLSLPLLRKSDVTIAEIAYQTGFNSPSYFSTCFKKHYNTTPEAYRASQ